MENSNNEITYVVTTPTVRQQSDFAKIKVGRL